VRDNPVEFEVFARNAKIFHNKIHNSHAWFSFDGMAGGPIYVYGNQGWFDDMPIRDWRHVMTDDRKCSWVGSVKAPSSPAEFDPRFDHKFIYKKATWLPVGMVQPDRDDGQPGATWMDYSEQQCERGLAGRVIKLALPPKGGAPGAPFYYAKEPIYVFNNSWFLRAPLTSTDAAANLRHWNNAIQFCEAGMPGYDPTLCEPNPDHADPATCGSEYIKSDDLTAYPAESGRIPFFDCFRWLPYDESKHDLPDLKSSFDYDVSSNGFPPLLKQQVPEFEQYGRKAMPGFANAAAGDFTLVKDAAAGNSGCVVKVDKDGTLFCGKIDPSMSYAGALAPDGTLYPGPADKEFEPPPD
jgi:hypothetical protein